MKKKLLTLVMLTFLLCLLVPGSTYAEEKAQIRKFEPGFVEPDEWGTSFGTISDYSLDTATKIPVEYDVREHLKLPAMRDQGEFGDCWAHATIGCLEINLIKKGLTDKSINLSELQLCYFGFNSVKDSLGNTKGESYSYWYNTSCYLCYGANSKFAMLAMSRGLQPTDEKDTPSLAYSKASTLHTGSIYDKGLHKVSNLSAADSLKNPKARVIGYKEIGKTDTTTIKKAIMSYGCVQASYCADTEDAHYTTPDMLATYCPTDEDNNHAIILIGWDDEYPKHFLKNSDGKQPSKDGAWLARNSWGDYNGNGGYFWIAYEDKSFDYPCVYEADLAVEDNNVYFYNNYFNGDNFDYFEDYDVANVYKASGATAGESLYAVGAWVNGKKGEKLVCDIYVGKIDKKHIDDAQYFAGQINLTVNNSGRAFVYTQLANPIHIAKGQSYALVVRDPGGSIKSNVMLYPNNKNASNRKSGQSFVKDYDGLFYDLGTGDYNYNCEIYGYTKSDEARTFKITYALNGGKNSSKNPSTYKEGKGVSSFKDPTREGYNFKGWFVDAKMTKQVTSISKTAAKNIKLYAKWAKKVPYSKTYTVSKIDYQVKFSADDKVTDVILLKGSNYSKSSLTISTVTINGTKYSVTQIAENAFKGNRSITSLKIGKSVTAIGKSAFYGCGNLKTVTILTEKLTSKTFGYNVFKGINSKATVMVPEAVYTNYKTLLKKRGITGKNQKIVKQ